MWNFSSRGKPFQIGSDEVQGLPNCADVCKILYGGSVLGLTLEHTGILYLQRLHSAIFNLANLHKPS